MSKKKFILLFPMLLCVTLFCACGKEEENQHIVPEWEDAYKEIVCNMESYLADPYILRQELDRADSDICIGYVCLSYYDGEYVTGIYDEYKPQAAVVNGKVVTEEEFKKRFDLAGLSRDSSIPRSRIKKEDGIVTALVIDAVLKEEDKEQ